VASSPAAPSDADQDSAVVVLNDPSWHTFQAPAVLARLRRDDPVHWHEPLRTWVLTKHEDVRRASREPGTFSVTGGIRLDDALGGAQSAGRLFDEGAEFLAFVDPPRHTELRRVIAPAFTPRAVAERQERIRTFAAQIIEQVPPGEPVEWVSCCARLPVMVSLDLLGLPLSDVDAVLVWSEAMDRLSSPLQPHELEQVVTDFAPLAHYLLEHIELKRDSPADDMISMLLADQLDGRRLTDANVLMYLQTVLSAGNDTVRSLLAGIVITFAERPDQLRLVARDRGLVPNAVEELLRWITPARGFLRTVMQPTEIRGRQLRPGERVYLAYDSANRDEDAFADPYRFDVTREFTTQQLSFGFGTHACIGAAFARSEATALLEALLDRFDSFELVGEPAPVITVLRNGWGHAPVVFQPHTPSEVAP